MKNKLIWRLKEQPTAESLRELVKDKILTNEEARQILFSSETEEDRDKNSLEAEIKFLRELVEKLSQNRSTIIDRIREVEKPYIRWNWYQPYQTWCVGQSIQTQSSAGLLNSAYNAGVASQNSNFSSIQTF